MFNTLLKRQSLEQPQGVALMSDEGSVSWSELDESVHRIATQLSKLGIGYGDSVALLDDNSVTQVRCFLALARIGSVIVPINPDLKIPEVSQSVRESRCRILLTNHNQTPLLIQLINEGTIEGGISFENHRFHIHGVFQGTGGLRIFCPKLSSQKSEWSEETSLLELKTSGTTGKPKRIQRTHGQLHWLATTYAKTLDLRTSDQILTVIPLSHGHGLCSTLLASLSSGASMYVMGKFYRRRTLDLLSCNSITVFPAVPFIYSILAASRRTDPIDLKQVRLAITGGAPLTESVWHQVFSGLGLKLRQSYGSTETGAVSVNIDHDPESSIHSVGTPLEGIEFKTFDEVLAVRSPAAAQWSLPVSLDSSSQQKVPLCDEEGWISMGDRVSVDSANRFTLIGRNSGVINIAGRKVYSEEVEAVLVSHSQIEDAAVMPAKDQNGVEFVKAKLVVKEPFERSHLIAYCREYLADYKIPRTIEIQDSIPRNQLGKIDRVNLGVPERKAA